MSKKEGKEYIDEYVMEVYQLGQERPAAEILLDYKNMGGFSYWGECFI